MTKFFVSHSAKVMSLAMIALAALNSSAMAQEAAAEVASDKTMLDTWVLAGGPTMIPIIMELFFILILIVFNITALKKDRYCPADLKDELVALMAECRARSAIELASTSPSYLGRLTAYALPQMDATRPEDLGKDAIEDAIVEFTTNENRTVFKWINILALCGQVAPMIGLFGTVLGMVGAFGKLSATGQADPAALAGDISVALLTTLWGLINALISLPAFFMQKDAANARIAECVNAVEEMVNASINTINAEAQAARIPEGLA